MKIKAIIIFVFMAAGVYGQGFVDTQTPSGAQPNNLAVSGSKWKLVFSDEFNGSEINSSKWSVDNSPNSRAARPNLGINSWFWRPANVEINDGHLVLKVKKEADGVMHCGSVNSANKFQFKYGYVEARIQVADVNYGTHTALWLQGINMGNVDGTAHDGAEVDIFESAWVGEYTKSVVHIDGYGASHQASTKQFNAPGIHDGYHVWGFLWTDNIMNIYYDGVFKVQYTGVWVVKADEYLWLSDGAAFGETGSKYFTDRSLGWLTEAYVDYIRVWQCEDGGNIVKNGDFLETMFGVDQAWKGSDMVSGSIVFDTEAYSINPPSIRFSGANSQRTIHQDINVTPNAIYRFSATARIIDAHGMSGATNSKNHALRFTVTDGSSQSVLMSKITKSNIDAKIEGEFIVPRGVTSIRMEIAKQSGIAYIDDVVIVKDRDLLMPSLTVNKDNKTIKLTKISANTTVKVVCSGGIESTLSVADSQVEYDLTAKPKGEYIFKLEGEQQKSFVINTFAIN